MGCHSLYCLMGEEPEFVEIEVFQSMITGIGNEGKGNREQDASI